MTVNNYSHEIRMQYLLNIPWQQNAFYIKLYLLQWTCASTCLQT